MANTALNRTGVEVSTNKSGGAVAFGDVVVADTTTTSSFTTTTSSGFVSGTVGVVLDVNGIANNAAGLVAWSGWVPRINLSSSASIGDYIKTHSVAKQGVPHSPVGAAGDFAQARGTGTNPPAWLFGVSIQGAATDTIGAYVLIRDEKATTTEGGSFTQAAWRTRILNTEVVDTGSIAALASNQITLSAGTYRVWASAPAFNCGRNQARLYNVTDAATLVLGSSAWSTSTSVSLSIVNGRFTIGASKAIELQHYCATTRNTDGFGISGNTGETEIYGIVELWKEP